MSRRPFPSEPVPMGHRHPDRIADQIGDTVRRRILEPAQGVDTVYAHRGEGHGDEHEPGTGGCRPPADATGRFELGGPAGDGGPTGRGTVVEPRTVPPGLRPGRGTRPNRPGTARIHLGG
ncbi:hypothetical protein ACWCYL_28145 [Streptomyces sp. 900105755]|uniref:hypothetical protein n=1 Tax=Streptomyces sp. 900105755 TaxID=3154389 RepID=UPI00332A61B0